MQWVGTCRFNCAKLDLKLDLVIDHSYKTTNHQLRKYLNVSFRGDVSVKSAV